MMLIRGEKVATGPITNMRASTLRALKRELGLGWAQIMTYMESVDDATPLGDCLGEDRFLAWVWAWMLNGNPGVTFADVLELTVGDIEFTSDEPAAVPVGEAGDGADPTPASAPEGTAPAVDALLPAGS